MYGLLYSLVKWLEATGVRDCHSYDSYLSIYSGDPLFRFKPLACNEPCR